MNPFLMLPREDRLSPEDTGSTRQAYSRYQTRYRIAAVVLIAAVLGTTAKDVPAWLHATIWVVAFAAFAFMLISLSRYATTWDELQQRIFGGAAANAFWFTIAGLVLNLAVRVLGFPYLDPVALTFVPFAAFGLCWAIARARNS